MTEQWRGAAEAKTPWGRWLGTVHVTDEAVVFLPMVSLAPDPQVGSIATTGVALLLIFVGKLIWVTMDGIPYFTTIGITTVAPPLGVVLVGVAAHLHRRNRQAAAAVRAELVEDATPGVGATVATRVQVEGKAVEIPRRGMTVAADGTQFDLESRLGDTLSFRLCEPSDRGLATLLRAG